MCIHTPCLTFSPSPGPCFAVLNASTQNAHPIPNLISSRLSVPTLPCTPNSGASLARCLRLVQARMVDLSLYQLLSCHCDRNNQGKERFVLDHGLRKVFSRSWRVGWRFVLARACGRISSHVSRSRSRVQVRNQGWVLSSKAHP